MINVELAEFGIQIDNKYEYLERMCADYVSTRTADITVSVTDEEIQKEESEKITNKGYLESLAVYRKIAEWLPFRDGILMHGVVIDVEGEGIAFLAKSGVGKTTHMMNWKKHLGDKMTVVNGDKPLVRVTEEGIFAYGTPWAGKENLQTNSKTRLSAICFIERSETNECEEFKGDTFRKLLSQTYKPSDPAALIKSVELIGKIMATTRFYVIRCNKDVESAEVAYEKIIKKTGEKKHD